MKSVSPVRAARADARGRTLEVVDEDRDRLGRVAGRLERDEPHLPEVDRVAVGERRERVLGLGPGAEVDPRAHAVAQLEVSGEEVGVEVREQDVLDPAAEALGVGEVLVDVALRVDDGGGTRDGIGDEVRRVCQAAEVVLLELHPGDGRTVRSALRRACDVDDAPVQLALIDGPRRARTADLLHAMQALSQLSYGPETTKCSAELEHRPAFTIAASATAPFWFVVSSRNTTTVAASLGQAVS